MKHRGFTLAELLIALALLGIIAAFTIPKVLQASTEEEVNAKLSETVSTLENVWYDARARNQILYGATLHNTIAGSLNTVAQDPTQHSWDPGAPFATSVATHPCRDIAFEEGWMQFANGVVVTGLAEFAQPEMLLDALPYNDPNHNWVQNVPICIDVNGAASPNLPGQDVFVGVFNQHGGFDGVPTSESAALKSFRWGSAGGVDVEISPGTPVATVTYPNLGDSSAAPCAVVGCRLGQ